MSPEEVQRELHRPLHLHGCDDTALLSVVPGSVRATGELPVSHFTD